MPNTPQAPAIKGHSFYKKTLFTATALLLGAALLTAVGEACVRLTIGERYKKVLNPPYNTAQKDDLLGWKMTPGYHWEGALKDFGKQPYQVSIQYDENGFKAFGDTASAKPKIFFLGDSFTASIEVSNENSFFNLIKDSLDVEVFAYGHSGYGSLQEYLVLDLWLDRIRPDLVVWGACMNDFTDNYAPLEIACTYKVGNRRPYLGTDGKVFYQTPMSLWQCAEKKIFFYRWLRERGEGFLLNVFGIEKKPGEHFIFNQGRGYEPFNQAVLATERIINKVAQRLPENTKLLAYPSATYQPHVGEYRRIFEGAGFVFTDAPALLVAERTKQGMTTKTKDGYHWNNLGQKLVAEALVPQIRPLIGL